MKSTHLKLDRKSVTLLILLFTLSLGCLCLPVTVTPTALPNDNFTPTSPPPPPPATTTLGAGLNPTGPWLLMETSDGLWAVNPDGSSPTRLTEVDYWNGSLQTAVQPNGNQVVFLSPGNYDFREMALYSLTLPDGTITRITNLTSPETELYVDSAPGDPGFEALRAVGEQINYAWSPDGTLLAFIGVMDGPSADVYVYEASSGEIQRISQDDSQNYGLSWSPDSRTLLYFGTSGFGTGAGYGTTGAWSASSDGTGSRLLYGAKSGGEQVVGWLDDTTAVLVTWDQPCGIQDLRLFDISTTEAVILNQDCFLSATAGGWRKAVIFANESGLYFLTAEDRTPILVSQEPVDRIDRFYANDYIFKVGFENGGLATYGVNEIDHQVSPVNPPSWDMDVAVYGAIWAWTSRDVSQPGAWISGPGLEIIQIFDQAASMPIWDANNNLLFFVPKDEGGFSLYRTTFSAFYQDLEVIASINAQVIAVTWLGGE